MDLAFILKVKNLKDDFRPPVDVVNGCGNKISSYILSKSLFRVLS